MRHNSFDALRLLAALAVMVSHAWQVTSGGVDTDPLYRLSDGQMTLGALAVTVFFGMSGYLVMGSWERRPDTAAFARARALRVWPALIVVVAATVVLIGPALSTDPGGYWASVQTWAYVQNLFLHQPPGGQRFLPGLFETNPLPRVVNGPLWTLEYEVGCYAALLALGVARLLTRESVTALAVVLGVIVWRVPGAHGQPWLYLPLAFATGAALHAWRTRVPWRRDLALAALLLVVAGTAGTGLRLLASTAGLYALLHLGRSAHLAGWGRWGDPSYGIYLWGMLVQQVVVALGYGLTPAANLLVSVPITAALACASWHLVERRALALRDRAVSRRPVQVPRP
ncbi:acyltransferase family protein [Deinococcus planocerae]|uniref:acyltransferase family protein n=1 Tax=Deinococcus planocerae TaxID=1737569 RepID=UPI000C7F6B6F|nr:acyltransferase [Deinococcus planocerae]